MYLATKTCSRQDPALLLDGPNGLGTPITDLCVITGKSKDIQAPVGYTKVEGDLNQGTGGSCVFLCAKRSLTESRTPVSRPFSAFCRFASIVFAFFHYFAEFVTELFPPARCYHRGQLAEPIAELVLNFWLKFREIRPCFGEILRDFGDI